MRDTTKNEALRGGRDQVGHGTGRDVTKEVPNP